MEWRQFCKLGEMMGDGLHREPGGSWISKEYRALARILIPEFKKHEKAKRAYWTMFANTQMGYLLEKTKCACGGTLKQSRSGSRIAYCQSCNARYKATTKKSG